MKARILTLATILLLTALSSLVAVGQTPATSRAHETAVAPSQGPLSELSSSSPCVGCGCLLCVPSPLAAFTYNPCVMCAVPGDFVFFNANWSSPLGHIATFTWDFGDGSPLVKSGSPAIGHDYFGFPGKWQVILTVTDHQGQSDTVSQLVMFEALPTFTVQPVAPIGRSFIFNASSSRSYNPTNPIKGYFWTFGDGTNATGVAVTHTYFAPLELGPHRVTLTLITSNGNPQASKTVPIAIFRATFEGLDVTATGAFNINTTTSTITASITLDIVNASSGQTFYSNTFNIAFTYPSSTVPGFLLVAPTGVQALGLAIVVGMNGNQYFILSKNPDFANQGRVNIVDAASVAFSFGSKPTSPNWNSSADLFDEGAVTIRDAAIIAFEFGIPAFQ